MRGRQKATRSTYFEKDVSTSLNIFLLSLKLLEDWCECCECTKYNGDNLVGKKES